MIGLLPKTLTINNKEYPIDSNFKTALLCFEVFNDPDLDIVTKGLLTIDFIIGLDKLASEDYEEASKQVAWFLDGGKNYKLGESKKVMDWEQDEQMIFSAVNKVAGKETREDKYIHWWTWLGYFSEIGEGLFSTVVNIRQKRNKGEKLTKEEQEFINKNRDIVDLKQKYSLEEQEEINRLNEMLK